MNNTNTKLSKISLRLKVTANAIILIISGFMTVCDQMPKFDPVTFEYIGQAYFWKNPLAIYWYVFFPSAIIAYAQYEEYGIYEKFKRFFDLVFYVILILTIFTVSYHYIMYW